MLREFIGYTLGLCLLLSVSCLGQEASSVKTGNEEIVKPALRIVGTPPPYISYGNNGIDSGLISQYIRTIFQDSRGNYWFGPAGESVVRFDGYTFNYFSRNEFYRANPLARSEQWNSVHAIAEDASGNLWFGTDIGVVKYDGHVFTSYTEASGLANTSVSRNSILVDRQGNLLVGTQGGVFKYSATADAMNLPCFSPVEDLPRFHVRGILEDQARELWFATPDKGIFHWSKDSLINYNHIMGLGNNYSGGLAQGPNGDYWFTTETGICRFDGNSFETFTTEDGIGGSEIWGLLVETSGIVWITARGSTTRYDPALGRDHPEAFRVFTPADGLNCCVQYMYQDPGGKVWWGAGQGLYAFDGERFYQVRQSGPWE